MTRLAQYITDKMGSIDRIDDFRFWMHFRVNREWKKLKCKIVIKDKDDLDALINDPYEYICKVVPVDPKYWKLSKDVYADDLFCMLRNEKEPWCKVYKEEHHD